MNRNPLKAARLAWTPLCLLILLGPACPARAENWAPLVPQVLEAPNPQDPLKATIHRLENGLTVYLSPNPQEPRIAAWIAVRAGSKHDPADNTGQAHYLEHMLFKGTSAMGSIDYAKERPHLDRIVSLYDKRFASRDPKEREALYKEIDTENIAASRYAVPNEIIKLYNQMGFQGINAFTSDEMTVYVCDLPANRLEAWALVEAERFAHPVFRLFQSELEAVYEEKNRSMDNPERILGEAMAKALYKGHPYARSTLGSVEHLKNPALSAMYEFYRKHYVPGNMAIALSGDFDRKAALAAVKKYFGALPGKPLPQPQAQAIPPPRGIERVEVRYEAEEKALISWPVPGILHPDNEALTVMSLLLDNSQAGLIDLELNQAQKVKGAGASLSVENEGGELTLWAVPKLGQTLEQAEALLLETLERLKAGAFTDEDLKAVITDFEIGKKHQLESNERRVEAMAESFLAFEPWARRVQRLERLGRVSRENVLRVARKYLGPNRVAAYRRPGKPDIPSIPKPAFTKIAIDPARQSAFAAKILNLPAKPIEPRWLARGKDYFIEDAPQGRLYAAPNPFNDLFALSWEFERGSRQERTLCAALGLLELSGAGSLGAEEFKKRLYRLGTSLSYSCGERSSGVHLSGLNENLWPSLELMRERFETPNIAPDILKKAVEVALGAHQDNKKNPGSVYQALAEYAMRGRKSAVLNELTDRELKALASASLEKIIKDFPSYKRRVGYVGNRPPREVAKLLDSRTSWRDTPKPEPLLLQKPRKTTVYFTHRDMVQSRVGLFAADETYDKSHAVDYAFFGEYMGGGMSSVIFQEIREARALAYAAGGGYARGELLGDENYAYGRLGCQADKTPEAARLLAELFQAVPLSQERFKETAKSIEESLRSDRISFRAVPGAVMDWEDHGLDGDPRPERFAKALKYRLEDLKDFSARFKDKPMTFYIMGHRDRLGLGEINKLGDFEEKALDQLFPY
ncbi:MAG: insulinase family protein [Elusimicrobia bacterium]|nr:insulinase family protein [Elusimicrobiota bacterium]